MDDATSQNNSINDRHRLHDMEQLVTYFRNHLFLQKVACHLQAFEKDQRLKAEAELAQLRHEVYRLQRERDSVCTLPPPPPGARTFGEIECVEIANESQLESKRMLFEAPKAFLDDERPDGSSIQPEPPSQEPATLNCPQNDWLDLVPAVTTTMVAKGLEGFAKAKDFLKVERTQAQAPRGNFTPFAEMRRSRNSAGRRATMRGVFTDVDAMKMEVRRALDTNHYDVKDMYHTTGVCQMIARSWWFEYLSLFMIGLNALWIPIDTDLNDAFILNQSGLLFVLVDNIFCTFFLWELCTRLFAFRRKHDAILDGWFVLDAVLQVIMVCETWVLPFVFAINDSLLGNSSILKSLRLSRISRVARMAKLLRQMPELLILLKALWVAMRTVFYTFVLLTGMLYVFAIAFRGFARDTPLADKYFRNVPHSMFSLFMQSALPDQLEIIQDCADQNIMFGVMVVLFILFASLTLMNMLVGILVKVVGDVSAVEQEELTMHAVTTKLMNMLTTVSVDFHASTISKQQFQTLLLIPEASKAILEVGVDPVALVDYTEHLFKNTDQNALSFNDFIALMLDFRGTNRCTLKDLIETRQFITMELASIHDKLDKVIELDAF